MSGTGVVVYAIAATVLALDPKAKAEIEDAGAGAPAATRALVEQALEALAPAATQTGED